MDGERLTAWTLRLSECVTALGELPSASVDLVYVDPPFASGKRREGRAGLTFDDRFDSIASYIEFLEPVVIECHRVLRASGSILLHVDWRTSHHVRILLENVFGEECFVNHLIWSYGLGGSGPRSFARKHDDILLYGRTPGYWFEPPMVPARSAMLRGRMKKATDVLDIPAINNMAIERTGWPTQKPLPLLKMLVGACCPVGGVVLDPMCGSGTTLVAAIETGRNAMGFDRSSEAIAIARGRLQSLPSGERDLIPRQQDVQALQVVGSGPPDLRRTA